MDGSPVDQDGSAGEPEDADPDPLLGRLERVEAQLAEFHRRSAHRESIIDRLHEENQQFRDGLRRVILEPVVSDLLRLHDAMAREAQRLSADDPRAAKLMAGFADDVALAVDRCGYELFPAVAGEPFTTGRHAPAGAVPTADPSLDATVAEPLSAGLLEIETGKVRRAARARIHRYQAPPAPDDAIDLALADDHPDPVGSE
ncbi:molecular chaperone GrpE [Actinoplanes sp. L3-i22]|uniref:molecular chaperone GrpE n=1 Tax=Actinoplanes sp. L3-i22 TaxID=2836373 RepID=UPI001C866471|nr:molecular chaperone GrpE [Actinoplanes sp. L3-i22]